MLGGDHLLGRELLAAAEASISATLRGVMATPRQPAACELEHGPDVPESETAGVAAGALVALWPS